MHGWFGLSLGLCLHVSRAALNQAEDWPSVAWPSRFGSWVCWGPSPYAIRPQTLGEIVVVTGGVGGPLELLELPKGVAAWAVVTKKGRVPKTPVRHRLRTPFLQLL